MRPSFRCFHLRDADHRIARDQFRQLRLAETVRSRRPFRQHQIADLGGRIPYPHFDLVAKRQPELGQHAARVDHRPRPIRRRLVPARRQAEQAPRIAGAQRADHEVMDGGRILQHHDVLRLPPEEPEWLDRAGRVPQQLRLELRIDPGARDDLRAAPGTDLAFVGVDPGIDRGGIHQPLLGQQAFQRLGAQGGIRRHVAVRVIARGGRGDGDDRRAMQSRKPRTLAAPS